MARGKRRHVVGVVVSDRMQKSVVVEIERLVQHPLYKKYMRRRTRLMAHDEQDTAGVGDRVELVETRPISKQKSWRVVRILEKAVELTRVRALEPTMEETETTPDQAGTSPPPPADNEPPSAPEGVRSDDTEGEVQS